MVFAYILIDLYLVARSIFAIFVFRTDVWSLGCLLFAWWFGHSPFECEFHGDLVKVRKYLFYLLFDVINKHNCDTKFCDV